MTSFANVLALAAELATYDMREYWPQPEAGKVQIVEFDSGRIDFYRRKSGDTFTLEDWWRKSLNEEPKSLIWSNRWHYRVSKAEGVVEFQDDYPSGVGAPLQHGHEIKWGTTLHIGDTVFNTVAYGGHTHPFATQWVKLVAHFDLKKIYGILFQDVIQIDDQQKVCLPPSTSNGGMDDPLLCKMSTSEATFYLAKRLGIVEIDNARTDDKPAFTKQERAAKICSVENLPDANCN